MFRKRAKHAVSDRRVPSPRFFMGERLAHDHVVQAPAESTDEKMGGIESAKLMESLRKGIG